MASGEPPREDREGLGPPPIPFRVGRERLPSFHAVRWLAVVAALIVLFALASVGKGLYADFLWFDSLGYASVYNTQLITKIILFFAGALLFLAFIAGNLWLARRLAPAGLEESFIAEVEPTTLRRIVTIIAVAGSIFLAIVFGSAASSEWETWLRLVHGTSFGGSDPAFHLDPGFYMFTLPGLWAILDWLLGMAIVTLLAVVGVYTFVISLQNFEIRLSRAVKAHVGALGLLLLAVFIGRYWLDIYSLAVSHNGVVEGATYTDLHARVPGYYILMLFAAAAGACIVWSIVRRSLIVAGAGVGAWIVAAIVLLGIYPAAVQRFNVDPNELAKEQPYIQRNIDGTRTAFNLQGVDPQPFQASSDVTRQTLSQDQATIDNIRLWDPRFEIETYKQQQEIQQYYVFDDVDVDRYPLNGTTTEVTLDARELSQDSLQANAKTWVNVHIRYTHGYGAVMNPVNKTDAFGLPAYNLQNIPPQGQPAITQPRIYYGQQTKEYEIVGAKQDEIDYEDNAGVQQAFRYDGPGVGIGSFFRRLIYAWEFGDTNLLISGQITGQSKLLYRRTLKDRISHIAPFLQLDNDPYLVIADGKLYWMQDAFTTSDSFPYSEADNGINYIRNSVKVVVDAYSGDTTFYLVDPSDPVAKTYQKIYPSLFKPFDAMPATLRSHIRYPEDLFRIQFDVFRTYHMTDPSVLYGKQDQWATPQEGTSSSAHDLDPYYLIMRLPDEQQQEFVLIRPFTPANKPNAIALMAARMDGPNYGKLAVYRFPSGQVIAGPVQVQSSIDAQPEISQKLTLLNQQGSQVRRGNLLLIPISQSYIYIEPVYLEAQQNPKPAVVAVIVYAQNKVFMEPSLSQALAAAVGEIAPTYTFSTFAASVAAAAAAQNSSGNGQPSPSATPGAATPTPAGTAAVSAPAPPAPPLGSVTPTATDIPGLIREAADANAEAQQRLRNGDFAGYGEAEARLQAALNRLTQLIAQPTASPAPRSAPGP